jgi:hypothetical protein
MKTKLSKLKPNPIDTPPQTAEHINGPQVGMVEVTSSEVLIGLGVPENASHQDAITTLQCAAIGLRSVRDNRLFLVDGSSAHSFREWCVLKFGEGIGIWLDQHL